MALFMDSNSISELTNGDRFEGQCAGNHPLSGVYSFSNGDTYKGEFLNGMKHGRGVYSYLSSGEVYDGEWRSDQWNGRGIYYLTSG